MLDAGAGVLGRLSLRARLVLGVIVLAAVGLAVADIATYASLRSFLSTASTSRCRTTTRRRSSRSNTARCGGPDDQPRAGRRARPSSELQRLTARSSPPAGPRARPAPRVGPAADMAVAGGGNGPSYSTVSAQDGDSRYRVRAEVPTRTAASSCALARGRRRDATPAPADRAARHGGRAARPGRPGRLGRRLGLRPLDAIETTAAAIAAGDLSRRVERAEPSTEVGRLGIALNAMLAQIEAAFDAREASEREAAPLRRRRLARAAHAARGRARLRRALRRAAPTAVRTTSSAR